jgi:microcystin-dependent protein
MAEAFIGEIRMMAFAFAPKGWAQCNGQLLAINQNQALFSLLGTVYGGDGRTNFGLPDLRGRAPIHVGAHWTQGTKGGEENHTLTTAEMPQHPHLLHASGGAPDGQNGNAPAPGKVLSSTSTGQLYGPYANVQAMSAQAVGTVGGGQPHTNMMPYTVVGFCICLVGIFPPRN